MHYIHAKKFLIFNHFTLIKKKAGGTNLQIKQADYTSLCFIDIYKSLHCTQRCRGEEPLDKPLQSEDVLQLSRRPDVCAIHSAHDMNHPLVDCVPL